MKNIVEKHRKTVEALGYSKEQAEEVIHSLAEIFEAVIDVAWGVHPAQQSRAGLPEKFVTAPKSCAKFGTKAKQLQSGGSAAPATEG